MQKSMSPKEKAIKLVERFENLQSNKMSDYSKIEYPTAKQCALIAVEEILKYQDSLVGMLDTNDSRDIMFWEEVQQEIEEL